MYCEKLDLVAHNKESPIDLIIEVALAIEAKGNLPSLCTLWIEECQLFKIMVERIEVTRPDLEIRTHSKGGILDGTDFKLENTDSSEDEIMF